MANLLVPRREEIWPKDTVTIPITSGTTLFIGSYVDQDAGVGRLRAHVDVAGNVNYGRIVEFDSPLQEDGSALGNAAGTVRAIVDIQGGVIRRVPVATAAAETDVGAQVFLGTDNLGVDLTLVATVNVPAVGEIIRFHSATEFDVLLYDMETMRGL